MEHRPLRGFWLLALALWNVAACSGDLSAPDSDAGASGSDAGSFVCKEGHWDDDRDGTTPCVPWSDCAAGTHQVADASATADRVCEACEVGTFSEAINAKACIEHTRCPPGTRVAMAGTAESDRACALCELGYYTTLWNSSECVPVSECSPGTQQTKPATVLKNPECTICEAGRYCPGGSAAPTLCGEGTWDEDQNPVSACGPWTDCAAGTFVSTEGTELSDRVCSPCADETFSTTTNAPSCTPLTACSGDTYESVAGSAVSDRQCVHYVSCLDRLTRAPDSPSGNYLIDPDGTGPNPAILVSCDMTTDGGGFTQVSFEDFSSEAVGWSDARRDTSSSCFTAYGAMLGGFELFGEGASSSKTYALLGVTHSEVRVDLDYIVIDSWDDEQARVSMDGTLVYDVVFRMGTTQVCGGSWGERGPQQVTATRSHDSDTLLLNVTSTLNQPADDESFGIDNVRVMVR